MNLYELYIGTVWDFTLWERAGNADKFSRFSNDVDSVDGRGDELCAFYPAFHK